MHADGRRFSSDPSAFIGGFIPLSIIHITRRKLDRFVNFMATKWATTTAETRPGASPHSSASAT